jgi:hypothetical protein
VGQLLGPRLVEDINFDNIYTQHILTLNIIINKISNSNLNIRINITSKQMEEDYGQEGNLTHAH